MGRMPEKAGELLEGFEVGSATAGDIQTMLMLFVSAPDRAPAALERLVTIRDSETSGTGSSEDLIARTTHAVIGAFVSRQRPSAETLDEILEHPALPEAIRSGQLLTPFLAISLADPAALQNRASTIIGLSAYLPAGPVSAEQATAAGRYWQVVSGVTPSSEAETLKAVRSAVARVLRNADTEGASPEIVSALREQAAQIDGAFARGELLDHPAPAVDFLWSSGNAGPERLDDLKGKVVVIDFWATWCGPCIRSFPEMAKLTAYYADYEVVVLGMTAPQGRHHGADGTVTTTGNDREREFALMDEFIAEKGITWPIAFSERSVWTEFGITGIPHVAIIDADGIVRYRGIHPMEPFEAKTVRINALLRAAGLDAPDA